MSMKHATLDGKKVRVFPAPPKGFDPFAASEKDLMKFGLPLRPDPQAQPGLAGLWERQATRYKDFEHLELKPDLAAVAEDEGVVANLGPSSLVSCGYELFSSSGPFTSLFATWTVPNLQYTPSPFGINRLHTFVGLGFLDVHVEMTVDSASNVTCYMWAQSVGVINMAVRPGDVISGSLCLNTNPAGTAAYFLANETTRQSISFSVDTGFPPAVTISAGVTRSSSPQHPDPTLASFGIVYFDELSAYATNGFRSLTSGTAVTMTNQSGKVLARPTRINEFTFKTTFVSA